MLRPIEPLHDHQRRVLRERLGEHGHALHVSADDLVKPPLVGRFVGGNVGDQVRVLGPRGVEDEAGGLRVRDGARKRLREIAVRRELDHPQLAELERAEVRREVVERFLHQGDHAVDVVGVPGVMVDGERDVFPAILADCVGGRLDRKEIVDRRLGAEVRDPPAAGHLGVEEVAGRQHGLIRDRRYCQIGVDPVAVTPEVLEPPGRLILEFRRPAILGQPVLAALGTAADTILAVHPERGRDLQVVEEGPVRDDPGLVVRIAEPALLADGLKPDLATLARGEGQVERVNPVVHVRQLAGEVRARDLERAQLELADRDRADE